MTLREQFGVNLRYYRGRAGFSQEMFAELTHLHRTEISLIERGKRAPRIETLVKLACILGVSSDDLLADIVWEDGVFVIGENMQRPAEEHPQQFIHPLDQGAKPLSI
jgi:transcriptional regulator with XRE-family HTH domain